MNFAEKLSLFRVALVHFSRAAVQNRLGFMLALTLAMAGALVPGLSGGLGAQAAAGGDLPGDPARVNYEMGFAYLLREDRVRARNYLELAANAQGAFADLARLELVRLISAEDAPPATALAAARATLLRLEDKTGMPRNWLAAAQAFSDAGRRAEALELALELPLRFPESSEAARALALAARIHLVEERVDAALECYLRLLQQYSGGAGADEAALFAARIMLAPGPRHNPHQACRFLQVFHPEGIFASSDWAREGRSWDRDFCGRAGNP